MQNNNKALTILSPFKDPQISYAFIGTEVPDPVTKILPEELQLIKGNESVKWQEEYARGRLAGRSALAVFKQGLLPILKGEGGEPLFPEGYVGSISHSGGMGVACVSKCENYLGLGIDLENYKKKRHIEVFKKIATERELSWILQDQKDSQRRGVLIFSIKESIYKAMYQAFKVKLKYMDAEILPNLDIGQASVTILKEGFEGAGIVCGFSFLHEFVISGVGVKKSLQNNLI